MHEYGTLKPVKAILRRGNMENNGGDEPNRGIFYAYVEMSYKTPCATITY
jgi:hypothetical protein